MFAKELAHMIDHKSMTLPCQILPDNPKTIMVS